MKTAVAMVAVLAMLALVLTPMGCICKYPNVTGKVQGTLATGHTFYDALVKKFLDNKTDATVHGAVISADLALAMAGQLQKQWCPDPALVAQAEKMMADAKAKAGAAGVK
jgi:hypothetical protein